MLPGHQDCTQAQGFAESKPMVAPGVMEASLLSWSTLSDRGCCQIIWESGHLSALGDGSELLGQALSLPVGSLHQE